MNTATQTATHVAVIPAKRDSSRCPRKNWRVFADGKCLTDWAVALVPEDLFGQVIVSTDKTDYDPGGACKVHHRDAATATVEADVQALVRTLINEYRLQDSYVWLLNPTSPFRERSDFEGIAKLIEQTACPAVVSVTPVSPFLWKDDQPQFDTTGRRPNTQDHRQQYYAENGMFYVFRGDKFLEHGTWYVPGVRRYVQTGLTKTIDIDTPEEFDEAARVWAALSGPGDGETIRNETLAIEALVRPPVAEHLTLLASHIRRYVLAVESLNINRHHRVIDASCGKGYGSHLLSLSAGQVIGLDINQDYLAVAGREFAADNLRFTTYDAYFAEAPQPVDKIVCIETYEHMPQEQQGPFVDRLLSALRPGGDVFVTAPLGHDAASEVNLFHLHEPSLGALHQSLGPRFAKTNYRIARRVDSFGQDSEYCWVVLTGYQGEQSK